MIFIAICCQVQPFPVDDVEKNIGVLQRGGDRLKCAQLLPREVTLAQRKQNSGHNDRVEELLWKIEAKSTLLNNSSPYKHNCKVSWNQLRR